LLLLFLRFTPSLGRVISRTLDRILNLNIFLGASEDVPHLSDLMFYQILIEGVGDLQPTNNVAEPTSSLQLYTRVIWL